jgi:hypothetical protein
MQYTLNLRRGMKRKTKLDRRIEHVQKGLKADKIKRPINEFAELCFLIGDQFDDQNTFTIKKEK